jgi:chromosomal replication initiation ATPase DnaA
MKTYSISDIPTFTPRKRPLKSVNEKVQFNKSRKIVHLVCCHVEMTYNELTEKEKPKRDISENKQIAAYIAIKETGIGWSAMGRILNDTHASMIYAFNNIDFAYSNEKKLRDKVNLIQSNIRQAI